jgi:hypothetical protein
MGGPRPNMWMMPGPVAYGVLEYVHRQWGNSLLTREGTFFSGQAGLEDVNHMSKIVMF